MTAMPDRRVLDRGRLRSCRRTASASSSSALPVMNADCPSTASGSALPWPKRCSRSAGVIAWRTATRLTIDAAASSSESIRLDSSATEPVSSHAANLTAISTRATATEA